MKAPNWFGFFYLASELLGLLGLICYDLLCVTYQTNVIVFMTEISCSSLDW